MTIRHAPLFVLVIPAVITLLALVGAPPIVLLTAMGAFGAPILMLLMLPARDPRPRIRTGIERIG